MVRKARAGQVTGGAAFGYRNAPSETGGKVRIIVEDEARVVRDIFERCARGQGLRTIAHALNEVGARCPQPIKGRPRGWAPSSVRATLYRELYRGEIVWNRTKKRDAWGQRKTIGRPASTWLRVSAPHLRIVSEALWKAAHHRLTTARQIYLRQNDGKMWGKPTNGIESKYLLTGLSQCGLCGGGLYVSTRGTHPRMYLYGCATFHRRGHTVCANNRLVMMADADREAMTVLEDELLDPTVLEAAVERATADVLAEPTVAAARLAALDERGQQLSVAIERLTRAIELGDELAPLVTTLQTRQQELAQIEIERQQIATVLRAKPQEFRKVSRELRRRAEDWRTAAGRNVSQARQILRKLVRGRLVLTPLDDGTCELSGQADYGKLFSGIPLATAVARPAGLVPFAARQSRVAK
jgi:hypothetical protein